MKPSLIAISGVVLALLAQAPQSQGQVRSLPSRQVPPSRPTPAPKAISPEEDLGARITLDVTRVNLLFTVSDKKGRFVTDLAKDDLEIAEAKKPQKVLEFTSETDLPLRIGILIDTSNSI